jgi:predicted Zn-dependent peptidase
VFADEMIQHEKTVILEEISDMEDNPEELIHENFVSNLFRDHPLGMPILGRRETVKSFDRVSLLRAFESHRAGNRIVIAAAGNVKHEELSKLITRYFDFNSTKVLEDRPSDNSHQPGRVEFTREGLIQGHICCGVRGLSYSSPDKFPFMLMNTVLGGGMSSRLFQNIREKFGFTYNVYSFADTFQDTGFFGVYMGTDRGKIDEALGLILKEFDDLRNDLLTDDEMERLKNQLKGNLMLGLEQVSSRMYRLAKMELYLREYLSLDDILRLIDDVTAEQVRDIANRLLQPDQQLITILTPE